MNDEYASRMDARHGRCRADAAWAARVSFMTTPEAPRPTKRRKSRLRTDALVPPEVDTLCRRSGIEAVEDLIIALVLEMAGDDARVTVGHHKTTDTDRRGAYAFVKVWVPSDSAPIVVDEAEDGLHCYWKDAAADSLPAALALLARELFTPGVVDHEWTETDDDGRIVRRRRAIQMPALYDYSGGPTPQAVLDAIKAWRAR